MTDGRRVPVELSWDAFIDRWVPSLRSEGALIAVNWCGPRATGYDVEVDALVRNVQHYIDRKI
jgi:hypothetical protein